MTYLLRFIGNVCGLLYLFYSTVISHPRYTGRYVTSTISFDYDRTYNSVIVYGGHVKKAPSTLSRLELRPVFTTKRI